MGDDVYQQCSGVRCQEPNSTRYDGVAHEMDSFSALWVFSYSQISVQN